MTLPWLLFVCPGVLAKYSRDLTGFAAEGKLDPVIGRHDETRRLIDVLCRRTKNRCAAATLLQAQPKLVCHCPVVCGPVLLGWL